MKKTYFIEMEWDLDTLNIVDYNNSIIKIIESIWEGSILLLGFEKVTYINSTAIWHIADWYNKLEELESEVIIVWVNETIMDTLNLVWLWDRINFYDNVDHFKLKYSNN